MIKKKDTVVQWFCPHATAVKQAAFNLQGRNINTEKLSKRMVSQDRLFLFTWHARVALIHRLN